MPFVVLLQQQQQITTRLVSTNRCCRKMQCE